MNNKVVIVGTGNVGMSYAFALINQANPVHELVLIDINEEKAKGEALDLNHGIPFGPNHISIKQGSYIDCKDAKIVCICAGANQETGETRLDLVNKNNKIFKNIVNSITESGFNGIYLIATNPVDIMTYATWKYANIEPKKVIGSGTTLDTARLRYKLGKITNISPKNVEAYVIGEHGDSEFIAWNNASIGLQPIENFMDSSTFNEIEEEVRNSAYEIIDKKGNTSYGIGMCLVSITNAILKDENTILSVSNYDEVNDLFFGSPCVINKDGIRKRIYLNLTKEEEDKLRNSIKILKDVINDTEM